MLFSQTIYGLLFRYLSITDVTMYVYQIPSFFPAVHGNQKV